MTSVGAKADALLECLAFGYRIPEFCVLDDGWMDRHLSCCELRGPADPSWRGLLEQKGIDGRLQEWLDANLPSGDRFAVRSSAAVEDGSQNSFAGQFETRLNVPRQELEPAILGVWGSAFSAHALDYAATRNIPAADLKMAVIIQRMLEPDASGVAFAIDPVAGRRDTAVVSAVFGLGEGLVSGELDADRFEIDLCGQVRETIVHKTTRLATHPVATTVQEVVPLADRDRACIGVTEARHLARWARELSESRGSWQDIEWCQAEGELWLLQSRPITGLQHLSDPQAQLRVWDNSNIIESYSGTTTPLTFSFVQHVYSQVYPLFFRFMGVEKSVIEQNAQVFQMVGLNHGRIYYNLLNWYQALSLLPGYAINARFMEQMMGVTDQFERHELPALATGNRWWRLMKSLLGIARSWFSLPRSVPEFHKLVDTTLTNFAGTEMENASLHQLADRFSVLETRLLNRWQTPLVNDFFAMIFFGVLRKTLNSWCPELEEEFQNQLLCAEQNIISTQPIEQLRALADLSRDVPQLVCSAKARNAAVFLEQVRRIPNINTAFEALRQRFGARTLEELKLETVTAVQDPEILARQLMAYVNSGVGRSRIGRDGSELRRMAESQLASALGHWKHWVVRWVLGHTRRLVAQRENLRFERTRVFDAARSLFLAIGHRMSLDGVLDETRDIFWLTKAEIFSFIDGTAVDVNVGRIAGRRRTEWAGFPDSQLPDRFETRGSPYFGNSFGNSFGNRRDNAALGSSGAEEAYASIDLQGTGCCAGQVTAEALVVEDPSATLDLEGKILVAARTDPGWTPLFPLARGILVERGSLLSHSAIVARELGIPAVVAIPGLLARVKSGDLISFDGCTGEVCHVSGPEKREESA